MRIIKLLKIIFIVFLIPFAVIALFGRKLVDTDEVEEMVEDTEKKAKQSAAKLKQQASKAGKKLSKRQSDILALIDELKETGMKPLEDRFKRVSTRTLRRDLNVLVDRGLIKRSGSTKNTKYKSVR